MATDAQVSGPLALTEKFTYDLWQDHFGQVGIREDTDGSAFGLTLPPSGNVAEVGSATIDSIAKIGGFPVTVPAGLTQSVTIDPSVGGGATGRTDLIVARFDSAAYATSPGPVRLAVIEGTEGSLTLPSYDPKTELRLWAVRRKEGESLNQAIPTDLRSWTADSILVADGAPLPQSSPLGTRATRDGVTYRRSFAGPAVDWVQEWSPTNAEDATVYDTGWINLAMTTGWKASSGQIPQVRRIGPTVFIRGRVETVSGNNVQGSHTPCYIPASALNNTCRPSRTHDYVQQVNVTGGSYRIWVATDGTINTLGFPSENNLYIATSYAVD
jgi:hypothetical protein